MTKESSSLEHSHPISIAILLLILFFNCRVNLGLDDMVRIIAKPYKPSKEDEDEDEVVEETDSEDESESDEDMEATSDNDNASEDEDVNDIDADMVEANKTDKKKQKLEGTEGDSVSTLKVCCFCSKSWSRKEYTKSHSSLFESLFYVA